MGAVRKQGRDNEGIPQFDNGYIAWLVNFFLETFYLIFSLPPIKIKTK